MEKLKWIPAGLLILALVFKASAATEDSFSTINVELAASVQAEPLTLNVTDVATFRSLSDAQLAALVKVLDATPTIAVDNLPSKGVGGTYYSLQHPEWPPLPGDTSFSPAWIIGSTGAIDKTYLLSDLDFVYGAPAKSKTAMRTMASFGAPGFGEDDGGTNIYTLDGATSIADYGTNLWIAQEHITNGYLAGIGSNTLADIQYEIQSKTNLLQSNWLSEGFILGSEVTNWTPLSVAQSSRTNLFIRLRSWADSAGNGLPDWWQLQYFGTTGVDPYGNPAGDGWSNFQKFQNGWNPNQFYTPAAPQGVIASLHQTNSTAAVGWLPSPGAVASYTVKKTDAKNNPPTVTDFSISSTSTVFENDISGDFHLPELWSGNAYDVSYQVRANYAGGNSTWSPAVPLQAPTVSGSIFPGANGTTYLAVAGVPENAFVVRLVMVVQYTVWEINQFVSYTITTNHDLLVSAFTNGLSPLPASWQLLPPEAIPADRSSIFIQSVDAAGNADGTKLIGYNFEGFHDGRQQLKDNLIFLLRAANTNQPFSYYKYYPSSNPNNLGQYFLQTNPVAYAYASYYRIDGYYDQNSVLQYYPTVEAVLPFENNYLYRNFVYDSATLTASGKLATGLQGSTYFANPVHSLQVPPTNYFQPPSSAWTNAASVLGTNQTRWLAGIPLGANSSFWRRIGMRSGPTSGFVSMLTNVKNLFGLPYLSTLAMTNGPSAATLTPGGSTKSQNYFYSETAQPQFSLVEYDFFNPNWFYNWASDTWTQPFVPGVPGFSATNTTQQFFMSSGSQIQIAGYAKLAIQNGYSNKFAYLGQYFDAAYKIVNGVVTTNTTGVLSPHGDFFATEPGPTALVTMPDIDTGARGTCTVYCVSLQLDKNHDGNMDLSFNGADATSQASPMELWVNNDYDREHAVDFTDSEQDDLGPTEIAKLPVAEHVPDCQYTNSGSPAIPSMRDLEDYFRLWTPGLSAAMSAMPTNYTVQLTLSGGGQIRIFRAIESNGGTNYLFDATTASNQVVNSASFYVGLLTSSSPITLNNRTNEHFIFCGVQAGSAQLDLQILDANQNVIADTGASLQIKDIKQIYERWTVGDEPGSTNKEPFGVALKAVNDLHTNLPASAFQYTSPIDANTPYILFVHGWNMSTYDKDRFAETSFKRLYWQGYQGRFGSFRWSTYYNFPFGEMSMQAVDTRNFDKSESNAWASAVGLLNKLTDLNTTYPGHVYLIAHSMGNVVAGEALRLATNQVVNTYVAMQAAVAAHAYDPNTPGRSLTSTYLTWDSGTPDRYANYWTNGAPCYFNNPAGAGTCVNFYNTNDWALRLLWTLDQDAKPDNSPTSYPGYHYSTSGGYFYKIAGSFTPHLNFPTNTYEIFSFCDEARCQALGRQRDVGGIFATNQVGLDGAPYGFGLPHKFHSGEFRSNNAQRWQFWNTVLVKMGLKEE